MTHNSNKSIFLIPVMLCFFCMGFVDLVGIASNYVKADLGLSDSVANVFPSLVFFWFLIFSVPTGMLMNKIGRKNTVLLSLVVTVVSIASVCWASPSCCCRSWLLCAMWASTWVQTPQLRNC